MNKKIQQFRDFKDNLLERLSNTEYARSFLDIVLEDYEKDGDIEAFLLALRDVTEARGGITKLAQHANLNRQNLYKVFSKNGNPNLKTLDAVLRNLGFRLSIQPLKTA